MKPRQFFEEICEPSVKDLINEPSRRRAWVAIIALFHFSDYLAASRATTLKSVKAEFYSEFPRFELVRDIANASKHFKLNREGSRKGLSVKHTTIGTGAAFSDETNYSDGTSHIDDADVVRVEFRGELIDVIGICKECLEYLRTKI